MTLATTTSNFFNVETNLVVHYVLMHYELVLVLFWFWHVLANVGVVDLIS